jgi:hypothetical protein
MVIRKKVAMLLLIFIPYFAMADEESREIRELKMADSAVFWALVASVSEEGQAACSQNELACSVDRAELGLALLGGKKSYDSFKALASMLKYRLDAGLGESFACYVLEKGRSISWELARTKPSNLRADCEQKIKEAMATDPNLLRGVNTNSICSTEAEIHERLNDLVDALKHARKCAPDDF